MITCISGEKAHIDFVVKGLTSANIVPGSLFIESGSSETVKLIVIISKVGAERPNRNSICGKKKNVKIQGSRIRNHPKVKKTSLKRVAKKLNPRIYLG